MSGLFLVFLTGCLASEAADPADHLRELQTQAAVTGKADWGHWGADASKYSSWTSHSNRLIPVYSFGMTLEPVSGARSLYRSEQRIREIYGRLPEDTLNPQADYFDQTDIYRLQKMAADSGKKRIILCVFDGMDWQTTQAAAIHRAGRVAYTEGRGTGLHFQDYRGAVTDFGAMVTSPHNDGTAVDVDQQKVLNPGGKQRGGYSAKLGGSAPHAAPTDALYPIGKSKTMPHAYTDSSSSATSMTAGHKIYNNSVNVDATGSRVETIAHQLQAQGWAVGVVTSVPISHATPACAYSHNVDRDDYQDLTRDLIGRKSIAHPNQPLPGVDVLIGCGWGEAKKADDAQGKNYVPGNRYLTDEDRQAIDHQQGGPYEVVTRSNGVNGATGLRQAAERAIAGKHRLFGFYGVAGGHLPFQTADGKFDPTVSVPKSGSTSPTAAEKYSPADLDENPRLSDMAVTALDVLSSRSEKFWMMLEAGDVDWANHSNNIDNSIGAVISGDAAVKAVTDWVEAHGGWQDTVLIVTADHGHYLVLDQPEALVPPETASAGRK